MLKCGWETLVKYYSLTDRSPVYIAAVVLHPVHKWEYFRKHWKQEWIVNAQQRMLNFWHDEYKGTIDLVQHEAEEELSQQQENSSKSWPFGVDSDQAAQI
jgi:hypothetical protein